MPLLIGGATTSRVHTAVKIDPNYQRGPAVYVNDASRAVGVASALLSTDDARRPMSPSMRAEYAQDRRGASRARRPTRSALTLAEARANALQARLDATTRRRSRRSSARACSRTIDLAELADYIDWTPFFQTWELAGRYPGDPRRRQGRRGGARAVRRRAGDAASRSSTRTGSRRRRVVGFWPANARRRRHRRLRRRDARRADRARLHTLRQQLAKREGRANVALADFVAPRTAACRIMSAASRSPPGIGEDDDRRRASSAPTTTTPRSWSRRWPTGSPKPSPSGMHQRVRKEFWGYAPDEALSRRGPDRARNISGIRPAPGYPAQPDHTEKATLFTLLDARSASASS